MVWATWATAGEVTVALIRPTELAKLHEMTCTRESAKPCGSQNSAWDVGTSSAASPSMHTYGDVTVPVLAVVTVPCTTIE